jgi:succinate dehydrogenase/fumarate reductase-like Fe-S protein
MATISCIMFVDYDTTNYLNQAQLCRMAICDTVLVAGNGQEGWTCCTTIASSPPRPRARPSSCLT